MRRSVTPFLLGTLSILVILPSMAQAGIPFWGPIIPEAYNACAANWGLVVEVINRVIQLLITLAIVIVAPIMIAWSGFDILVNPTNPGKRTEAKQRMLALVIGIVIALSGWLIVDALMAVLYRPTDKATFTETWFNLIRTEGSPPCVELAGSLNMDPDGNAYVGLDTRGVYYPPANGVGACDKDILKGIIPQLEDKEAATFACIARYESSCGTDTYNYSWNKPNERGVASSAYGAFQILLKGNSSYFNNQVCYQAAGVSSLNCAAGFGANGFTYGGNVEELNKCLKAASNLSCNFVAAYELYKKQGFNAWTADKNSAKQKVCIQQVYNAQ